MSILGGVARELRERTGCAVFFWQYLPEDGVLGDENDRNMHKMVEDNGIELTLGDVLGGVKTHGTLALCSFKEDVRPGERCTMHLYQMSDAVHERMWNAGEASRSSGELFSRSILN